MDYSELKNVKLQEYIDFTPLEGDDRTISIQGSLNKLEKLQPDLFNKIFSEARNVLEPGAGAGGMTVFLYHYFREHVFPSGFPQEFIHTAIELYNLGANHVENLIKEQVSRGSRSELASHYQLIKGINMIDFFQGKEIIANPPYDLVFFISVLDVIELTEEGSDLRLVAGEYNLYKFVMDFSNYVKVGGYVIIVASPDQSEAFENSRLFRRVYPTSENERTYISMLIYERVE
jgi:hypothetical protein